MLISKTVKIKWNARNKKRFVNLGYKFTKINDIFEVNIKDLSDGSSAKIKVKCDYCGKIYEVQYNTWVHRHNKNSDCCSNPNCTSLKAKIALRQKYGTENVRKIKGVNEKIKNTNLQKYGCENPFGNKDIQNKIIYKNKKRGSLSPTLLFIKMHIEPKKLFNLVLNLFDSLLNFFNNSLITRSTPFLELLTNDLINLISSSISLDGFLDILFKVS